MVNNAQQRLRQEDTHRSQIQGILAACFPQVQCSLANVCNRCIVLQQVIMQVQNLREPSLLLRNLVKQVLHTFSQVADATAGGAPVLAPA